MAIPQCCGVDLWSRPDVKCRQKCGRRFCVPCSQPTGGSEEEGARLSQVPRVVHCTAWHGVVCHFRMTGFVLFGLVQVEEDSVILCA